MLQKAIKKLLSQAKKELDRQAIPHGKQTLKQLMMQNTGVSNIEITKDNIKAFESTAKKYGIDFALKKDATETPPRYLVFFKGRDADALTAAKTAHTAQEDGAGVTGLWGEAGRTILPPALLGVTAPLLCAGGKLIEMK